jgi:acetyl esterase
MLCLLGSRITHHFSVATLAEASKCIFLSVEYRLSPEFKHPFGLEDCLSVVKWAIENKTKEFNLIGKIGVCGDSAGGTYAGEGKCEDIYS